MKTDYEQMLTTRCNELGVTASDLEHLNRLFYSEIRMCGCGYPDAAIKLTHDILTATRARNLDDLSTLIGTRGAIQIVMGALDEAGLTEHGTSFNGSWLTPKGEYALGLLDKLATHNLDDLWEDLVLGLPHDGGECGPTCWTSGAKS